MLHQPVVSETAITDGVRDIGVPEELSDNTWMPSDCSIVPMIYKRNSFVLDFNVRAPEGDIPFGKLRTWHPSIVAPQSEPSRFTDTAS
jgi:hypothetical protein